MQAKILNRGDVTIVTIQGRMEIERANYIKKICLDNLKDKKVVFCLSDLSFVGSSGIQNFFCFLHEMNSEKKMNIKLAGLKPDFMRLWSYSDRNVELHSSIDSAVDSFL
jgi:anti-anti-sigma factor